MRLTLRNLLAYMHQMMSPEDMAAFDALVKTTPKVQTLIERCRNLPQRADLAAPDVDANGKHSADAVSCYLDFCLADEHLPDFEKGALASDELMAEISACHRMVGDVLSGRVPKQSPTWRERMIAVVSTAQSQSEENREETASTANHDQHLGSMSQAGQIERMALQDSGELSQLLDDEDDEELSLDVARDRERQKEQQAVAEAASAFVSGGGGTATAATPSTTTKQRLTAYGTRDPYKQAVKGPALLEKPEKQPIPVALVGGAAGGVLALGLVVWLIMSAMSGPPRPTNSGQKIYGITDSSADTCEMSGTITFGLGGAAPLPDNGALVMAWPVGESHASQTVRSAVDVMQDVESGMQSAYNEQFVVAKTDDDGRYRMRMHDNTEFHVVILSQRVQTDKPVTWGDTINELKRHVEDPATLVGRRVYHYQKVTMPENGQATVDYTFTQD